MAALRRNCRSVATVLLFIAFAVGGAAVSFLLLPFLRSREAAHRLVRALWRALIRVSVSAGLIAVDDSRLRKVHGRIIVANHPSLIDVVLLTALLPDVYSIAKSELTRNVFIGRIVRKVMIPNDESVMERASEVLSHGGNVLIFPEGTRTPIDGMRGKLKRGAAQLAIRISAPVSPVRIEISRRILAKGQPISDMGDETVLYRLCSCEEIAPPPQSAVNRNAAIALTDAIEKALFPESSAGVFKCRRCGECCRIEGFVRIDEGDVTRIAGYLGMSEADFISRETVLSPDRRSLALKDAADGACSMLDGNGLCRIYPVRPEKCRTFPYEWVNPGSSDYCPGLKELECCNSSSGVCAAGRVAQSASGRF